MIQNEHICRRRRTNERTNEMGFYIWFVFNVNEIDIKWNK